MLRPGRASPLALQALVACILAQPPLHLLAKMTQQRAFLYVALLLAPLALVFVLLQRARAPVSRRTTFLLVLGYLGVLCAATLIGGDPRASLPVMATKYSAVSGFLLAWMGLRDRRDAVPVVRAILLVGAVGALYSIWQQVVGFPDFETRWAWSLGNVHGVDVFVSDARRATGFTIYSALNTQVLSFGLLLLVALPAATPGVRPVRWLWIAATGLAILFSQTRGIWLGAFAGLLVVLVVRRRLAGKKLAGLFPLLGLQALLVGVAYAAIPVVRTRIDSFQGMLTNPEHPFLFRVVSMWIPAFRDFPPRLLGYGPGALSVADNMYLQTLVSAGVLGLAALLALHAGLILLGLRRARHFAGIDAWTSRLQVAVVGIVVCQLVSFVTGDYLLSVPGNLHFWTLAGLATSPRLLVPPREGEATQGA